MPSIEQILDTLYYTLHGFLCNRGHGRGQDHLLFQKVLFMETKVHMSLQLCQGDLNLIMQKDTI